MKEPHLHRIPIHYVSKEQTVCGLPVSREMAMTYNLRRTTCRNCLRTAAYIRAFAAQKRHVASGGRFIQLPLFKEEK